MVSVFLFFGFSIIHYAVSVGHTSCEDGWLAFEGNCYLIGHTVLKFVEAEHFCRQHHGHVVEPYNTYENNFIKDQLRYMKLHCGWIGATDELVEDSWKWYTSGAHANFTDWYSNQPGKESGDEDCAVYWQTNTVDYQWADIGCTYGSCTPVCKQPGFRNEGSEIIG